MDTSMAQFYPPPAARRIGRRSQRALDGGVAGGSAGVRIPVQNGRPPRTRTLRETGRRAAGDGRARESEVQRQQLGIVAAWRRKAELLPYQRTESLSDLRVPWHRSLPPWCGVDVQVVAPSAAKESATRVTQLAQEVTPLQGVTVISTS